MDLEGFSGGIPIRPNDVKDEIAEAVQVFKRSDERRMTEIAWATEDLDAATEKNIASAGIDFLTKTGHAEVAHQTRCGEKMHELTRAILAKAVKGGALDDLLDDAPDEIKDLLKGAFDDVLGIESAPPEVSGDSSIEGIGSFDDLPVFEPEAKEGDD